MSVLIKDTTFANNDTPIWTSVTTTAASAGQSFVAGNTATNSVPQSTVVTFFSPALTGAGLLPNTTYQFTCPISYGTNSLTGTLSILCSLGGGAAQAYAVFMNGSSPLDQTTLTVTLTTSATPTDQCVFAVIHDNVATPTVTLTVGGKIYIKKW